MYYSKQLKSINLRVHYEQGRTQGERDGEIVSKRSEWEREIAKCQGRLELLVFSMRDTTIYRSGLQMEMCEHFKSGIADKQKSFTSS